MAEWKTKKTDVSVDKFLAGVPDEQRRKDCRTVLALMKKITKQKPAMWGSSIVGFGSYRYEYESGRTGEWPVTGFSPRKAALTLYIMSGFADQGLMEKLGKFKTGQACLYIKKLDDVHLPTLAKLIKSSVAKMSKAST